MKYDYDSTGGDYDNNLNFTKYTTNGRLFSAILFTLLSVAMWESVAVGDLLNAPIPGEKGFRIMSQAEIDDIAKNGWRGVKDKMNDKHFLDNLDDAERWADEVAPDLGFPADGIAEVDFPENIFDEVGRTHNVDGGFGNGKVVWESLLSKLPKPTNIHPPKKK